MGEGKVVPVRHRMSPLRHPLEALLLCVLKYIQQSFFKEILSPSLPAQLEGGDAGQLGFIPPPTPGTSHMGGLVTHILI